MAFNTLMLTCLQTDLSFHEAGVKIGFQRQSKEQVLFFVIDEQSNPSSAFRSDLGIGRDEPLCDGLVFFANDVVKVVCLVELKGCDLDHAMRQLVNSVNKFRAGLREATDGKRCSRTVSNIVIKACVIVGGSSNKKIDEGLKKAVIDTVGKGRFSLIRTGDEFGKFIRT